MTHKMYLIPFHVLVILNYVLFLLYKDSIKDRLNELYPDREEFGGSWKFLTHWNIALQLVYFCIAFLNDLFGTESKIKQDANFLQILRDYLFATLAFPIGTFVPIVFWILYNLDRDLVYPQDLDDVFPQITNHMMHTTPLPSQILELVLVYHSYPSRKLGFPTIIIFCQSYIGWIFYVAYAGGPWVYGVFEVLSQSQRLIFVIGLSIFSVFLYLTGECCNKKVWEIQTDDEISSKDIYNNLQQSVYTNSITGRNYSNVKNYKKYKDKRS